MSPSVEVLDDDGYTTKHLYYDKAYVHEKSGRVSLVMPNKDVVFFYPEENVYSYGVPVAQKALERLQRTEIGGTFKYRRIKFRRLSTEEVSKALGGETWKHEHPGLRA